MSKRIWIKHNLKLIEKKMCLFSHNQIYIYIYSNFSSKHNYFIVSNWYYIHFTYFLFFLDLLGLFSVTYQHNLLLILVSFLTKTGLLINIMSSLHKCVIAKNMGNCYRIYYGKNLLKSWGFRFKNNKDQSI